jgi:hypothetical protein
MSANERDMVGGGHYRKHGKEIQHWDIVAIFQLDYFQGQITKYVMRWRDKGGIADLEKAAHYLQKYIEVEKARESGELKDIEEDRHTPPEGTIFCRSCKGNGCPVCDGQGTIYIGEEDGK